MKRKFVLDAVMTVVMLCLLNLNITGVMLHEILGITIFALFLIHKGLNFKWIKAVTKNIFKKSMQPRAKMLYAVDVALLVLSALNVGTGILISTCVFKGIEINNIGLVSQLHHIFAYLLLTVLVVHVGLHWTFITNAMKMKKGGAAEKIACCVATAVLVVTLLESNTIGRFFHPKKDAEVPYRGDGEKKQVDDGDAITESIGDSIIVTDRPTLEEYLSGMICTACGRRCLLTNPACSRGRNQQQEAVREYNETYQTEETYQSGSGDRFNEGPQASRNERPQFPGR